MKKKSFSKALLKAAKSIVHNLPVIIGVILLIGIFKSYILQNDISAFFTQSGLQNAFIGTFTGSIFAGNAINSYIIGGEFLNQGISLFAITSFLAAWVTVGIIQIPAEISFLGTKFTLVRNMLCFVFCFFISLVLVAILGVIS